MVSLKTRYVGLELASPLVVASAGITETLERMRKAQECGAGAVVMKSLFENELNRTSPTPRFKILRHDSRDYKTFSFFSYEQASEWGPDRYAEEITRAKAELEIKIIASINCVTLNGWASYARKMEEAGADALELNVSCPHGSITFAGREVEENILKAVRVVREAVTLPIIPKISPQLTSPLNMVHNLKQIGANGVTIFNRTTGLDIDVEIEMPVMHRGYAGHGGPWAIQYPLRWISEIAPKVDIDISASGGVSSAQDVIKYLLAGATVVQTCTAVYMHGYEIIREFIQGLEEFMRSKGYSKIEDFRGKVSGRILSAPEIDRRHTLVSRILQRRIAPCKAACPIDQSAQAYISLIREGKYADALRLVKEENPFPAICGRVCHHPCEDECVRGVIGQPIAIAALKRFLADYELFGSDRDSSIEEREAETHYERPIVKGTPVQRMTSDCFQEGTGVSSSSGNGRQRVAVVGSGPAGLTAAYYLAREGYGVTVFEALPVLGGMLSVGIPEYRLPKDIVKREIDSILEQGIEVKTGVRVGRDITLDGLKREGYGAIFVAVGAHKSQELDIPGEEVGGLWEGLSFLSALNMGRQVKIGRRVAVIGGGDTAVDSARSALRLGAEEVYLVYRRTQDEMPARQEEVREAEEEGVRVLYLVAPTRILQKDGHVAGLECINLYLAEADKTRRRRPVIVERTQFILKVDTVISAIGQIPDLAGVFEGPYKAVVKDGLIQVDPDSLMTRIDGVFAGGDAVTGAATVVEAIAAGKKAARSIDLYLRGGSLDSRCEPPPVVDKWTVLRRTLDFDGGNRQEARSIPLPERLSSFKEIRSGYTEDEAVKESSRCLACGCALGCGVCERICIYFAVDRDGDGFRIDEEKCDGCGLCVERCPNECILMVPASKG